MNLDEYIKARDKDSNLFWRLESGVHQNLLDEAIYKIEELEEVHNEMQRELTAWIEENKRLREAVGLATTCVPDMEIDADDPIGMMHKVVAENKQLAMDRNKKELDTEEHECAMMYLDDLNIPRHDNHEAVYSLVGRIRIVLEEREKLEAENKRLQTFLNDAWQRMDRARDILTDSNPRPECNWGMLDTKLDREAYEDRR